MKIPGHPNLFLALLAATSAVALGMVTHTFTYATIMLAVLAAHLLLGFRLTGKPRTLTVILLTVPFAVWYRSLPREGFAGGFAPIDLLLIVACYTLALGVYHLLTWRTGGSRHQSLAASITAFALAGTVSRLHLFTPLVPIFTVLVLLELRRDLGLLERRPTVRQLSHYALALAVAGALAISLNQTIQANLPTISRWLTMKLLESSDYSTPGFSRVTHLGSISRPWDQATGETVVLRHWRERSEPAPRDELDYLRGAVYRDYDRGSWQALEENQNVNSLESDRGRNIFNLTQSAARANDKLKPAGVIYPEREQTDAFFLPLGVERLSAFGDKVAASAAWTVSSPSGRTAGGYVYYEPRSTPPPPGEDDLNVPDRLRDPLRRLALGILAPAGSPEANAQRLAAYFEQKFEYRIGIELVTDKDPLLEFLEDIHAGHCEYFASAAVLLLRSVGVPARYVTGYVCSEQGLAGAYRLARRKDAHAWVEIYLADKGWRIFDPTPPPGRPAPLATTAGRRLGEFLGTCWRMIGGVMVYGGLLGFLTLLWSALVALILRVPLTIWGVIVVVSLAWIYRQPLRRRLSRRRRVAVSARVKKLRAKLQRAEKILAAHGLEREPGTTAGALLRRVRAAELPPAVKTEAQTLLEEYQATRFRPESAAADPSDHLRRAPG